MYFCLYIEPILLLRRANRWLPLLRFYHFLIEIHSAQDCLFILSAEIWLSPQRNLVLVAFTEAC